MKKWIDCSWAANGSDLIALGLSVLALVGLGLAFYWWCI